MLKILFSPAEGKKSGGNEAKKELFGFKKFSDCEPYINDIFDSTLMCAIKRYDGVAYDYLDFNSLETEAKEYAKSNTIIFSNLYGPLLGGDTIANYKVKQGNNIGGFVPDKFYKDRFSYQLDLFLANSEILDLRAGYYDKFYEIKKPHTTLKFLKDGKVVSHWAKAYRGLVLRAVAQKSINSMSEFMALEIEGLSVAKIKVIKNKTEVVYNIMN
ncbi:MAG: peroxide stress protein YaaA [Sulfurimonas sp.]|jgi:hypothetical protein